MTKHSVSQKHVGNQKLVSKGISQLTLEESISGSQGRIEKENVERRQTLEFEIDVARSLSNHKISPKCLDCLQEILKKKL